LAAVGRRKISDTQTSPVESTATPMPIWVYAAPRMLARCGGEAMNALWTFADDPAKPTFSPRLAQQHTACESPGVCCRTRVRAMVAACLEAAAVRSALTVRAPSPDAALAAFVALTRLPPASAFAVFGTTTSPTVAATAPSSASTPRLAARRWGTGKANDTRGQPPTRWLGYVFRYV
jgi:hypothetical protein